MVTTQYAGVLQRELETFENNIDELLKTDEGKYALVHENEVIETYSDQHDAIAAGYEKFGNVPFLVKLIEEVEVPANFVNSNLGI